MQFTCNGGSKFSQARRAAAIHRLHHGGKLILEIVPDPATGLYRICWPDIGLSPLANLSRCKDAALGWAEHQVLTEDRKTAAARRLKSWRNFSWAASPMRSLAKDGPQWRPAAENARTAPRVRLVPAAFLAAH